MSTSLMTRDERIANIQRLGYAQAEALVALYAGYFARRQFDVWIGIERGKQSEDFLADLLDRGHCRRYVFAHNRQVVDFRFAHPSAKDSACRYGDLGLETGGPFATHPCYYLPLFGEIPSSELVHVTPAATRLGQAQAVFERVLSRRRKWLTKVADPDRLHAHFRDRQLFEERESSNFDRLRLDARLDDRDCFSGRHFAQMFARWKASGDEAIRAEIAAHKMPNGRFSSCILTHDYDLFGRPEAIS